MAVFEPRLAQGAAAGHADAPAFSPLWLPTTEDIATENVVNAAVASESADYVASVRELVPKHQSFYRIK